MKYNYSDSEIKKLLKTIVVLVDTREKENQQITDYFSKKKIVWKSKALDCGDYTCMIPADNELGIPRDIVFSDDIVVERKASLEELSGNLSKERKRFENELIRAKGTQIILMVENGTYSDLVNGNYSTGLSAKAFLAALATFSVRYNFSYNFVTKETAGNFIYWHLYYAVRERLIRGF
jgi:ERCC4-type nuclease